MNTRTRTLLTTLMGIAALSLATGVGARDWPGRDGRDGRDGYRDHDRGQQYSQWDKRYDRHQDHGWRDRPIYRGIRGYYPVYYPRYYESWRYYEPPYYAQPYYGYSGGPSVVIDFNLPPIVIR